MIVVVYFSVFFILQEMLPDKLPKQWFHNFCFLKYGPLSKRSKLWLYCRPWVDISCLCIIEQTEEELIEFFLNFVLCLGSLEKFSLKLSNWWLAKIVSNEKDKSRTRNVRKFETFLCFILFSIFYLVAFYIL